MLQYEYGDDWEITQKQILFPIWGMEDGSTNERTDIEYYIKRVDSVYVYKPVDASTFEFLGKIITSYDEPSFNAPIIETICTINNETGVLSLAVKTETSYDENMNIISESMSNYNPTEQSWVIAIQEIYEYNTDGMITLEEDRLYSWTTGELTPTYRQTFAYNSEGNLERNTEFMPYYENAGAMVAMIKKELRFKAKEATSYFIPKTNGYFQILDNIYGNEFYQNGAIDQLDIYDWDYTTQYIAFEKTAEFHYSLYDSTQTGIPSTKVNNVSIDIYPNPASSSINIKFMDAMPRTVKIINMSGAVMIQKELSSQSDIINIDHLSSEIYGVIITSEDGTVFKQKIVKE